MDWFRMDNTEGYAQADLDALNADMRRRGAESIIDADELAHLGERVQNDYDSEKVR